MTRSCCRKIPWGSGIDPLRLIRFFLSAIDRGVRGAIDDDIGKVMFNSCPNCALIADVELLPRQRRNGFVRRRTSCEGPRDLTASAGDQNFHGKQTASRSDGATASFADKVGIAPGGKGHWMPISGSFHAIARSCAGA